MKRLPWWPIIISVSALLSVAVIATGAFLRPAMVVWFFLICPGMAFVRLLHIRDFAAELTLAIASSIAMSAIVAEVMVLTGTWSYERALWVLIAVSMVGVTLQIIEPKRRAANAERREK